ncbi:MAG: alpha/beta hydrolase [Burkholderiaceae bacterium]|mgnify:CR=1 FL=1|nr:alpha/beta hydrolase [Burkholderiaceae bacterium]
MKIKSNGVEIEVEDTGADGSQAGRPVVLLIMGLGMQLIAWPPALVQSLVDAGYRVIRHDNRDVGLSSHLDHLGVPNLVWAGLQHRLGFSPKAPYTLTDMAADALGVVDALKIGRFHVVGVSMGGMIAQRVAIAAPQRVASLTSIMSSSGARGLPSAEPAVLKVLLSRPASTQPADLVEHYVNLYTAIGSPDFTVPQADMRERILAGVMRSYRPVGTMRQMLAIIADSTRAAELANVRCPTLVVHGDADPLVPLACGEDTARRIHGAQLKVIAGMGHDLPPPVVEAITRELLPHLQAANP